MTLNNMVQDPSMIHEILAYERFARSGSRVPHRLRLRRSTAKTTACYLNIETLDDVSLESWFGAFDLRSTSTRANTEAT